MRIKNFLTVSTFLKKWCRLVPIPKSFWSIFQAFAQIRGPNGSQDEIAELTATVAKAKAENNELECDKVEGRDSHAA